MSGAIIIGTGKLWEVNSLFFLGVTGLTRRAFEPEDEEYIRVIYEPLDKGLDFIILDEVAAPGFAHSCVPRRKSRRVSSTSLFLNFIPTALGEHLRAWALRAP
jgi:hypothetical protein